MPKKGPIFLFLFHTVPNVFGLVGHFSRTVSRHTQYRWSFQVMRFFFSFNRQNIYDYEMMLNLFSSSEMRSAMFVKWKYIMKCVFFVLCGSYEAIAMNMDEKWSKFNVHPIEKLLTLSLASLEYYSKQIHLERKLRSRSFRCASCTTMHANQFDDGKSDLIAYWFVVQVITLQAAKQYQHIQTHIHRNELSRSIKETTTTTTKENEE